MRTLEEQPDTALLEGTIGVRVEDPDGGFENRREAVADKLDIDPQHISDVKLTNDD